MTPIDDLGDILPAAFCRWVRGVADRRSAFRTPTVATVAPDGTPQIRTMVLRGFDANARTLTLHTDRRAGKCIDIAHKRRVALHVYDRHAALQIRLSGTARLHIDDEVAAAGWARSSPSSRACYAINPAPGTPVPAPPEAPKPITLSSGDSRGVGFDQFALMAVIFDQLDWLLLHHSGHRRARFNWGAEGPWQGDWLVP